MLLKKNRNIGYNDDEWMTDGMKAEEYELLYNIILCDITIAVIKKWQNYKHNDNYNKLKIPSTCITTVLWWSVDCYIVVAAATTTYKGRN